VIITHVIPYMHPHAGGPPVVVDRLCRGLAGRGWDVRVLTTDCAAPRGDTDWASAYAGYPLEVVPASWPRGYGYGPSVGAAARAAVARSRLVHLHTLWTYPTMAAARACRRLGVPYVVMPHGMIDPNSLGRKRLKKWLYGRLWEWPNLRAAAAMAYTHPEEQGLARGAVGGLPPGHILPLGADEPPAPPGELAEAFFRSRPGLRGRRLVVFLGRLHPKKGLDLLIPAFAEVARRVPHAHLLLVGPADAGYEARLRGLVAAHGLGPAVTFTGPLAGRAKWEALAAGEVFALPSYQENFALTVAEALRCGVPVVLSRRVNIWRDVTGAGAGLACDLEPPGVAAALVAYLEDAGRRAAAGARGRALAAERYGWDRCVEAAEGLYHELLGTPRAAAPCR
jgi:glycosyltransferase involved in cell wall biosynthesis